ncbi:MAG: hypothetical protein JWO11_2211, partial [Nocardioides sp.]|nr:hypothetical protein [Nocardioides sp.]
WKYDAPTCDALTVTYPSDLPSGQANDVNIRLETDQGQVTLNYHNNEGTWSDTTGFTYSQHANWPVGVTSYTVSWVQVGGSNYHWEGDVSCLINSDGDDQTLDAPLGVTEINGWRTSTVTINKGTAATADSVVVEQPGLQALTLQRLTQGAWQPVKTVVTTDSGNARVTFPRQQRRGTFTYRLAVSGTESVTGTASARFKVRVR